MFFNHPLAPGLNSLALPVPLPPALVAGGPHSRWRFTTYPVPVPTYTGLETDGEVEDHEVHLEVLDFGDAPDPTYPTLLGRDGARHRIPSVYWLGPQAPDADPDGQPDAGATGDDLSNLADEDGVVVLTSLVRGGTGALQVTASGMGFLNAWIDFNADGDWATAGDQVATDLPLAPGPNPVPVSVPATAWVGPTFGRFRFGSQLGLLPTGLAIDGEVEDHALVIYQAGPDTNQFRVTNILFTATNEATIWWDGDTNAVYETQYLEDLMSTSHPPWTPWGAWVTGGPLRQADSNAAATVKFYRVVAPYAPPPP